MNDLYKWCFHRELRSITVRWDRCWTVSVYDAQGETHLLALGVGETVEDAAQEAFATLKLRLPDLGRVYIWPAGEAGENE